ncbi:MAG: amino acid adenylation domain-containing protein [Vicinamibacterales bacterium]
MDNLLERIAGLSPAKREILEHRLNKRAAIAGLAPVILPRSNDAPAQASFAQQRLWFLHQLDPDGPAYNVPRAIRLTGPLNHAGLERALDAVVRRHDTFRTRFNFEDGVLQQIVGDAAIPLTRVDLTGLGAGERQVRADQLIAAEAVAPFDLSNGPVIRTTLLMLAASEHILLLTTHHIVSDAWSADILFRELGELYDAFTTGRPFSLPPLPIQYADFAAWQRQLLQGDVLQDHLSYWRGRLGDAPAPLDLPGDVAHPPVPSDRGGLATATLSKALAEDLFGLSRREGVTPFMTLLAGFQILLARYAGQEDVVVGSTIAGRNQAETEGLIGFFINTLALRTNLRGNPTFKEVLRRVKETAVGAYAHQDLPFERLVEDLQPERDPGHTPFFRVMFQFKSSQGRQLAMHELAVEHLSTSTASSKFDLMLTILDDDGVLTPWMEYSAGLFGRETIDRMLGHYTTLLRHAAAAPERPISELSLMTEAEEHRLVHAWNQTGARFPRDRCIHHLFEAQAALAPAQVAVLAENDRITSGELNARANQVAHHLRRRGVGRESRVAISVERSIDMVVGLLGILKAGAAYVPLDPSYPAERAAFVLRDSQACAVLTQNRLAAALAVGDMPVIRLDGDWGEIARESRANPSDGATAQNLAHVIYTSGSTGMPKGVASPHSASVNRLEWMWSAYPFAADEVCCQKTSLSFVDAVAEIFSPLLRGIPLVTITDEVVKDVPQFVAALAVHRISRLVLVPSLLQVLLDTAAGELQLPDLRYCVCSGEALPVELAARFREQLPRTTLLNLYGSSEVAADVTSCEVGRTGESSGVHIGRPIANIEVYVLDARLRPVPVGVLGEIHVGGEGLARGYLGQPDLTAARFIPDPFSGRPGARLFGTGDLGRFRADGNLDYRGRRDYQVKVRGFRIELSEIEATLKTHPDVGDAVVVARGDGGDKELVAYLVAGGNQPATKALRDHLRRTLPDYMVPSAFVRLDALPLTTSGKINRLALPAPENERSCPEGLTPPRTPTEEILSGIWADVLAVARVGVHDDFFDLGGHSLLLAGVAARIRDAFQMPLPLRVLFERPTIAALAAAIERARLAPDAALEAPLQRVPRDGGVPLSFGQERLWFADQLEPANGAYNIPRVLRLKGPLDVSALAKGLASIVARHEVLRTAIVDNHGRPGLATRSAADVAIESLDLRDVPAAERASRAHSFSVRETQRPFDLASSPLFRVALVRLGEEEHLLVLTLHHIVGDAWSIGVFMRELVSFYNGYSTGGEVSLPALPVQYADFAAWQRQWLGSAALRTQLEYWRRQLAGAPPVSGLPLDRPHSSERSTRGARELLAIPAEISEQLQRLARASSVTRFMTMLAAFQSLLACLTGEDDVVVGSPIAGRNHPETDALIGNFVNTLVLRLPFAGDPTFRETLRRTREMALGAFANQDVPFEKLVEELRPQRTLSHHPLFQVWFVLQSAPGEREEWRGLSAESLPVDNGTTRHDLQLTLWETAAGLEGAFTYRTDLFSSGSIVRMAEQFNTLLALVVERPDVRLSEARRLLARTGRSHDESIAERLEQASLASLKSIARKPITSVRQRTTE